MRLRFARLWSRLQSCNDSRSVNTSMHTNNKTMPLFEIALLVLLGFLGGIPYALTKISLATIPPITMVAARVSLAAIVLWIVVFAFERKLPDRAELIPRFIIQG